MGFCLSLEGIRTAEYWVQPFLTQTVPHILKLTYSISFLTGCNLPSSKDNACHYPNLTERELSSKLQDQPQNLKWTSNSTWLARVPKKPCLSWPCYLARQEIQDLQRDLQGEKQFHSLSVKEESQQSTLSRALWSAFSVGKQGVRCFALTIENYLLLLLQPGLCAPFRNKAGIEEALMFTLMVEWR